jgi:hypothetical protein
MRVWRWLGLVLIGLIIAFAALWLARGRIAAEIAKAYFRAHGVNATVEVGRLGLSGAAGRFALGPARAPVLSAERIELEFDPLRLVPYVTEVRLVRPVVRAELAPDGSLRLGALQSWLDSLAQGPGGSRYVSDQVKIFLAGLHVFLSTPGGPVEMVGDASLVKSRPLRLALSLRPATLAYKGTYINVRKVALDFDSDARRLDLRADADLRGAGFVARKLVASLTADGFDETVAAGGALHATHVHLLMDADSSEAGTVVAAPHLDLTAQDLAAAWGAGGWQVAADLEGTAAGRPQVTIPALGDRRLAASLVRNLAALKAGFAAHLQANRNGLVLHLLRPFSLDGAAGGRLRLDRLEMTASGAAARGAAALSLSGGGLPAVSLVVTDWQKNRDEVTGQASLASRFDYAMLRGVDLKASGAFAWTDAALTFKPSSCATLRLAAFHPAASDLATRLRADLCGTVRLAGAQWRLQAVARNVSADLPLPKAAIAGASARLAFAGTGGGFAGRLSRIEGALEDRAQPIRFRPLAGTGEVALAAGVWRGQFQVRQGTQALGAVQFSHDLARGEGAAHIDASHLAFAPGALQPSDLSPLLAALRQAKGQVRFEGDLHWSASGMDSDGKLATSDLEFLSPLGAAHGVKAALVFSSLLPPKMPPGQAVEISRIDWTLPISTLNFKLGYGANRVDVDGLAFEIAQGRVSLTPLAIDLAHPSDLEGKASLKAISLDNLIAASNLQGKIQLQGKISGVIPFTMNGNGFHIADGRIAADGPGRLSIDRSLWTQGATAAGNAVQDFAYQALEHLAFDQLSAGLNSVAGGRLKILFHITGRNEPPKPQIAELPLTDLVNGTALTKPIPLPSGTPINLTLETNLNFDELLKSYAAAWSKALDTRDADQSRRQTP